jgi:hypothetical protein
MDSIDEIRDMLENSTLNEEIYVNTIYNILTEIYNKLVFIILNFGYDKDDMYSRILLRYDTILCDLEWVGGTCTNMKETLNTNESHITFCTLYSHYIFIQQNGDQNLELLANIFDECITLINDLYRELHIVCTCVGDLY